MLVPKQMIVEQLRSRGDAEAAERAEREFEEKVDTDMNRELLTEFDVDIARLEDDFGGQSPAIG